MLNRMLLGLGMVMVAETGWAQSDGMGAELNQAETEGEIAEGGAEGEGGAVGEGTGADGDDAGDDEVAVSGIYLGGGAGGVTWEPPLGQGGDGWKLIYGRGPEPTYPEDYAIFLPWSQRNYQPTPVFGPGDYVVRVCAYDSEAERCLAYSNELEIHIDVGGPLVVSADGSFVHWQADPALGAHFKMIFALAEFPELHQHIGYYRPATDPYAWVNPWYGPGWYTVRVCAYDLENDQCGESGNLVMVKLDGWFSCE